MGVPDEPLGLDRVAPLANMKRTSRDLDEFKCVSLSRLTATCVGYGSGGRIYPPARPASPPGESAVSSCRSRLSPASISLVERLGVLVPLRRLHDVTNKNK